MIDKIKISNNININIKNNEQNNKQKTLNSIKTLIIIMLILLINVNVFSLNVAVINDKDWHNVFHGLLYAKIKGYKTFFILNEKHALDIAERIPGENPRKVIVIESNAVYSGFDYLLKKKGINFTKIKADNLNKELLNKLNYNVNNYYIISSKYGYDAFSIASYAVMTKSWVFFDNELNDLLYAYKKNKKPIFVFSRLSKSKRDFIKDLNPKYNYKDSIYENSLNMASLFLKKKSTKTVVLSNGEFLEEEMFRNDSPNILVAENTPNKVYEFLKRFNIGILIGPNLMHTGHLIHQISNLTVLFKYAQTPAKPKGVFSRLSALDLLLLPIPKPKLKIDSISYNTITKKIELNIDNQANGVFVLPHLIIKKNNETKDEIIGNVSYLTETSNNILLFKPHMEFKDNDYIIEIELIYGVDANSLDHKLKQELPLYLINILEKAKLNINSMIYDKNKKAFILTLENPTNLTEFAKGIITLSIDDEKKNLNTKLLEIPPKSKINTEVFQKMNEYDLNKNEKINYEFKYGLSKKRMLFDNKGIINLKVKSTNYNTILMFVGLMLITFIIIVLLFKKKTK